MPLAANKTGVLRAGLKRRIRRLLRTARPIEATAANMIIAGSPPAPYCERNKLSRVAFAATWWAIISPAPAIAVRVSGSGVRAIRAYELGKRRPPPARKPSRGPGD